MTRGPNCTVGNGPLLIAIEFQVDYLAKMLSKFQKEALVTFDSKLEPKLDFLQWKNAHMVKTIWTEQCRSWYRAGSAFGNVTALWPG
jgi:cyclohexanone monooxygenase